MFKTKKAAKKGELTNTNHTIDWEIFHDGTSKENKKAAIDRYTEMLASNFYYSVSLTKVIDSTDY